jgi:exosortase
LQGREAPPTTRAPEFGASPLPRLCVELACLGAATLLCVPALALISRIWEQEQFLAHGYLIPIVSAVLLFQDRAEIADAYRRARPPRLGWLATLAASLLMLGALIGDVMFLAGLCVPLLILATVFALAGRELLARVAVAVAFLALMVPAPGAIVTRVLVELKLLVTAVALRLLQALGEPVAASGNQIHLPGHTLFVADACSGLTSILTLIPLACVVAYFGSRGLVRRAAIVASVVPLAMAANIARVVITVLLVRSQGVEFAQGLLHQNFGLATYLMGTLALLGTARLLR